MATQKAERVRRARALKGMGLPFVLRQKLGKLLARQDLREARDLFVQSGGEEVHTLLPGGCRGDFTLEFFFKGNRVEALCETYLCCR